MVTKKFLKLVFGVNVAIALLYLAAGLLVFDYVIILFTLLFAGLGFWVYKKKLFFIFFSNIIHFLLIISSFFFFTHFINREGIFGFISQLLRGFQSIWFIPFYGINIHVELFTIFILFCLHICALIIGAYIWKNRKTLP
ncbi:MAG: hypothetical protein ACMXYF_05855 [Candidatus Woesearchaeota archaeon]